MGIIDRKTFHSKNYPKVIRPDGRYFINGHVTCQLRGERREVPCVKEIKPGNRIVFSVNSAFCVVTEHIKKPVVKVAVRLFPDGEMIDYHGMNKKKSLGFQDFENLHWRDREKRATAVKYRPTPTKHRGFYVFYVNGRGHIVGNRIKCRPEHLQKTLYAMRAELNGS